MTEQEILSKSSISKGDRAVKAIGIKIFSGIKFGKTFNIPTEVRRQDNCRM